MSFFDTIADAPVDTMPMPSAPALADCMPAPIAPALDAAPVADKKRRVCPMLEEDEGKVEQDKKELFSEDFEGEAVVVVEACAERPRAPLTVTKETILAAIDSGDKDYLRRHCSSSKNTVNKLFANTHDSFSTVEKNAGKKRVVGATTLARAIYRFATAPTKEAAAAHHAVIEVLLRHCGVTVKEQPGDFLHFMAVDAWQMARKTPEVPSDPSPHSQLKHRWLLARLFLQADPNWLVTPNVIIETLRTFITLRKAEFYVPLLEDTTHMKLLQREDAEALRKYAEEIGSDLAVATICKVFFAPPPPPAEA